MLNHREAGRRFEDFRIRRHWAGIEVRARDRHLACQLRDRGGAASDIRSAGLVGRRRFGRRRRRSARWPGLRRLCPCRLALGRGDPDGRKLLALPRRCLFRSRRGRRLPLAGRRRRLRCCRRGSSVCRLRGRLRHRRRRRLRQCARTKRRHQKRRRGKQTPTQRHRSPLPRRWQTPLRRLQQPIRIGRFGDVRNHPRYAPLKAAPADPE